MECLSLGTKKSKTKQKTKQQQQTEKRAQSSAFCLSLYTYFHGNTSNGSEPFTFHFSIKHQTLEGPCASIKTSGSQELSKLQLCVLPLC